MWHATLALTEALLGLPELSRASVKGVLKSASMGAGLGEWEAAERGRPRTG
ncbi:MAG: hypothetical protein QXT28_12325 [Thermofilaceae archaeon]